MKRLAILGAGGWGTALAVVAAGNFEEVRLWTRDPGLAREAETTRENRRSLPGIRLPDPIRVSADARLCLQAADLILVAVPCAHIRSLMADLRESLPVEALIVSAAKGLEPVTLLRMSEVVVEASGVSENRVLALSGPTFARETACGAPTAVVIAGARNAISETQQALARPTFRVYSSEDRTGVEIGGALKNVVAIGAGMASGLGLGHNAVAALVTRGLAEITRLACALGAESRTLSGLAGLGDLVLTCTGEASRNRTLGRNLSQARSVADALRANTVTTEGVRTAGAALALGRRFGIEMPIAAEMNAVLEHGRTPEEAIRSLMERSLKQE